MANFFVRLINYVIKSVGLALQWLIDLLPQSPFGTPSAPPGSIDLGYVSWAIPFQAMIASFAVIIGAIATYYTVRIAARWIKIARG